MSFIYKLFIMVVVVVTVYFFHFIFEKSHHIRSEKNDGCYRVLMIYSCDLNDSVFDSDLSRGL